MTNLLSGKAENDSQENEVAHVSRLIVYTQFLRVVNCLFKLLFIYMTLNNSSGEVMIKTNIM